MCVELSRGNTDDEGADLGGSRAYRAGAQCLADLCVVKEDRITVPGSPGAMIIRVPACKNTCEGKNIHVLICDELHEWTEDKHEKVYTVLTNGFGARRQPLVLQITTAGDDKETIAGKQYDRGKMLQAGQLDDPRYHFKWFEPAEDADWTDMESTRQANPSFDVTVREPFFADMLTKKAEHIYRRYFLNQWVTGEKRWMRPGLFEACRRERSGSTTATPSWSASTAASPTTAPSCWPSGSAITPSSCLAAGSALTTTGADPISPGVSLGARSKTCSSPPSALRVPRLRGRPVSLGAAVAAARPGPRGHHRRHAGQLQRPA